MPDMALFPPTRRPDLVVRPLGENGQHVVKDPHTGSYYTFGEQESFLLLRLDGKQRAEAICAAFEERFGDRLSQDDLQEFVQTTEAMGFLQAPGASGRDPGKEAATPAAPENGKPSPPPQPEPTTREAASSRRLLGQSLLYWRANVFDPDRLFTWLAPQLWFIWTRAFLVLSLGCILVAAGLVWANRQELISSFAQALRWETLVLVWLTLLVITTLHEGAHGLTCKHYGGEVHEIGFLLLYFMPCFFCNVSDAWLFREKSKRLWVTLAGGYCDLCTWALAVFAWRLMLQNSLFNYIAWVVLSVLGTRVFFNFNPLLKLDGYYLLSDLLEMPNLQSRALGYVLGQLRWLLWGAPRPAREPWGKFLVAYGITSWLFGLLFLVLTITALSHFLGQRWGTVGILATLLLGALVLRGLFHGVAGGEVSNMIWQRHKRLVVWGLTLSTVTAALFVVHTEDRASGAFRVHAVCRAELRAPVAGFLREVYVEEGSPILSQGAALRLEVPNLASRIAQKQAEVREVQARLHLLEVGPRPEEVVAQRRRVERARSWRELAQSDLARVRESHAEELAGLDRQIAQHRAEFDYAREVSLRSQRLVNHGALDEEQYRQAEKKSRVSKAQLEQVEAAKRARRAAGIREVEAELVRRERELAEAEATLTLLTAGTRPEEIDAERARLARAQEELRYLQELQEKVSVYSPVGGVVTTPRLAEKIGQYFREGELIGVVEAPALLEAEILMTDQEVARVQLGQAVELKVRTRPFQTYQSRVDRIAPRAVSGDVQSTVTVYCRLENAAGELRPGMVGYSRVACGRRPLGQLLLERVLRFLRTEFWW